jgi:hypothetical protein
MPVYGLNDLRIFFGTGVPVAFQGKTLYPDGVQILGLFDRPLEMKLADQGFGGVDVGMPEVRLPCNAFNPMPRNKDAITVDGVNYTIADSHAEDDGATLCYGLKLA